MSDDLIALKILTVSDAAAEREALRSAASQAPVLIDVVEVDGIGDAGPACNLLTSGDVDVIFLDARMPSYGRQAVLDAARTAGAQPMLIAIGAPDLKLHQLDIDGLTVDGLLAKPIDQQEARTLLNACVRARMPSRALVVDDSATVRSVIRKVLQSCRHRFEIDEAADGTAALEMASKQRFDVVLLDCNMPGLDGFATLAGFLNGHGETKVVMITATNDINLADKARAAGAHDVLYKPFYAKDVDAMMYRLHGLVRRKAV